jgi:cytochrome oxidase maturation protein, cbb3-type
VRSLIFLLPLALGLGAAALAVFFWTLFNGQYEDLKGAGERIFVDEDGDLAAARHTAPISENSGAMEQDGEPRARR